MAKSLKIVSQYHAKCVKTVSMLKPEPYNVKPIALEVWLGMDRRLAPLLIIPLLLASFLAGWHLGQPDYVLGEYEGRGITVELYLYKNGELVYVDYDDPAVNNFLSFLAKTMESGVGYSATTRSGTTISNIYTYYGAAIVGISDDTASAFTQTLNELPGANVLLSVVDPTQIVVDEASKSITISGTITIPSTVNNFTVGWVGLYIDYGPDNGIIDGDEVLIFADPLGANAFTANPGDVITVVYKIVVP